MKRFLGSIPLMFLVLTSFAQPLPIINVYCLPGVGSDFRLFSELNLPEGFVKKEIAYFIPSKETSMCEYARELAVQIDTSMPYVLVGTSLGGMLATEMADFMNPLKVIIIASAKSCKELPPRYTVQRKLPLYKMVSGKLAKKSAMFLQPIVEPDRKQNKETFIAMFEDKDPEFINAAVYMIIHWERMAYDSSIMHLHGTKDHTIPIRNVENHLVIQKGSHMMTLTKSEEISICIRNELCVL